jgi:hypothetical protein
VDANSHALNAPTILVRKIGLFFNDLHPRDCSAVRCENYRQSLPESRQLARHQLNPHPAPQSRCSTGQRCERQAGIPVIQKPIQRRTAGVHAFGHRSFSEVLLAHAFFNLHGEHFLHCGSGALFEDAFFFQ